MKRLIKIMFAVIFLLCLTTSVSAAQKEILFTKSTVFSNVNTIRFENAGSTYKEAKLNDGTTVMAYCFNHQYEAPPANSKLSLRSLTAVEQSRINSFIYILENGWNGSTWKRSGNFTNEEKYYITQLTIWGLQGTDGGGINVNSLNANNNTKVNIKNAVISFLKDAKAHASQAPVAIAISPKTLKLTLNSKKDYYETTEYKVTGSGYSKYNVTLTNAPSGTIIYVPSDGTTVKSGSQISAGKSFIVKVPVSKITKNISLGITVTAKGTKKNLEIYESSATCYSSTGQVTKCQDIGVPVITSENVKDTATATATPVGSLTVRKVSVDASGKETDLKDVKIVVKNSSGTKVAEWNTTNENPKKITNLPLGTYTIHEEVAPTGYTKAQDVKVTVGAVEGEPIKLVNVKDRQPVYISKQDATTGTELPGAKLVLKDSLGGVVEEWTSGTTPHLVSKKLDPGKYVLSETMAPEGYQLTTETVSFMVNSNGGVDTPVVMKNKPKSNIKISKQDITTGKELPGATLTVKNAAGEVVDEWVSTTTPHYLPDTLTPGKYTLIEKKAPAGYGISEEVVEFEITGDGIEKTVVMTNSPIPVTADIPMAQIIGGIALALICGVAVFIKIGKQEA